MPAITIKCHQCHKEIITDTYKHAYCKHCDVTHQAETEIIDMFIGEVEYTLTGKTAIGKVSDDHGFITD